MNWKNKAWFLLPLFLFACGEEETSKVSVVSEIEPHGYASTRYLIEAKELKLKLSGPNALKLVDFRIDEQFNSGHIEGAVNIWRPDIADTSYTYGGMMPQKEQLEELLGSLGISPSDTIIIYDDRAAANAARLWWILRVYGHEHMAILNGGMKAWSAAGGALTKETGSSTLVEYTFNRKGAIELYADRTAVEASVTDPGILLLDGRSTEEFSGELLKDGAAYAGSIPGAIHLNFEAAVDYSNKDLFHSADSLTKLFNAIGVDGSKPVIIYCQSGVRSAHTLFVLTELLGYENISNYDGSWIEWSHTTPESAL